MNLTHEVTLFFTDGEDQGEYSNASSWILGARAWADNLTVSEADNIESFILVDMIGDSDLTLRKTRPGNSSLWNRTENKIRYLDEVCNYGESTYFDFEEYDSIIDDHVPADELGIPAIDIIDTRYGNNNNTDNDNLIYMRDRRRPAETCSSRQGAQEWSVKTCLNQ